MLKRLLTAILLALSALANAQEVYVHVSNTDLYTYIDELANAGITVTGRRSDMAGRSSLPVLSEADRQAGECATAARWISICGILGKNSGLP